MQHHFYHSFLRMSALLVALVLIFESGLLSPVTKQLASDTHTYLANAIGIQAAIKPTDLSLFTAELTARENELAAREAAIAEREISVSLNRGATSADTATYILSILLFILLLLIGFNYFLDYMRIAKPREQAV